MTADDGADLADVTGPSHRAPVTSPTGGPTTGIAPAATRPRLPGWVLALALYAAARLVTAGLTLAAADGQPANLWTPASPGYGEFVTMWDGERYQRIAEHGYPLPLPVDALGRPTQSEWAFFPAYPALVRLVMLVTGAPFEVAGPALSTLFGAAATVYVFLLFARHASRAQALLGVAVFVVFPTAPVLQYGYSESTCLLGLFGLLYHLDRRQYPAAAGYAVLLGLSRPIGLAVVPVIAVHAAVRWWQDRRGREALGLRERIGIAVLFLTSVVAALSFPAVVGLVSGLADGYQQVQVAWRVGDTMRYFTPWVWMSRYLFGAAGPVLLAAVVVLVVAVLASPAVRSLGLTMWSWCVAYTLYLAAVLDPFTSVPRFALFYAPLCLALAGTAPAGWRRRLLVGAVCALFLVGQAWWIFVLWRFTPPSDLPP